MRCSTVTIISSHPRAAVMEGGGELLDQTLYIHQRLYDDPRTPGVPIDLHSAAAIGYYECVQEGISSGKDLNACNKGQ